GTAVDVEQAERRQPLPGGRHQGRFDRVGRYAVVDREGQVDVAGRVDADGPVEVRISSEVGDDVEVDLEPADALLDAVGLEHDGIDLAHRAQRLVARAEDAGGPRRMQ